MSFLLFVAIEATSVVRAHTDRVGRPQLRLTSVVVVAENDVSQ